MFKKVEEIRKESGMSQIEFAELLGDSRRTYLNRITGIQPYWTIDELIKAAEFNKGKVTVEVMGKTYNITIKEIPISE